MRRGQRDGAVGYRKQVVVAVGQRRTGRNAADLDQDGIPRGGGRFDDTEQNTGVRVHRQGVACDAERRRCGLRAVVVHRYRRGLRRGGVVEAVARRNRDRIGTGGAVIVRQRGKVGVHVAQRSRDRQRGAGIGRRHRVAVADRRRRQNAISVGQHHRKGLAGGVAGLRQADARYGRVLADADGLRRGRRNHRQVGHRYRRGLRRGGVVEAVGRRNRDRIGTRGAVIVRQRGKVGVHVAQRPRDRQRGAGIGRRHRVAVADRRGRQNAIGVGQHHRKGFAGGVAGLRQTDARYGRVLADADGLRRGCRNHRQVGHRYRRGLRRGGVVEAVGRRNRDRIGTGGAVIIRQRGKVGVHVAQRPRDRQRGAGIGRRHRVAVADRRRRQDAIGVGQHHRKGFAGGVAGLRQTDARYGRVLADADGLRRGRRNHRQVGHRHRRGLRRGGVVEAVGRRNRDRIGTGGAVIVRQRGKVGVHVAQRPRDRQRGAGIGRRHRVAVRPPWPTERHWRRTAPP